jgi:hypothetical protein
MVAFQAELVFEGVEGALDRLAPAAQRAMPAGLIGTIRTHQDRAVGGDHLGEVAAREALIGQQDQPRSELGALSVQQGRDHLPLAQFGAGRHQATGSLSGVASTYSRKPQK